MACPKCGYENKSDASVCAKCYFDLKSDKTPLTPPPITPKRSKAASPTQTVTAVAPPPSAYTPPAQQAPPPYMPGGQQASGPSAAPGGYQTPPPQPPPGQYQGRPVPGPGFYSPPVMDYAGFWTRLAAQFIDGLLLMAVMFIVVKATAGAAVVPPTPGVPASPDQNIEAITQAMKGTQAAGLVNNIFSVLYFIGMNTAFGATLGKMAMGIKIVKEDGSPIGIGTAVVRYLIQTILAAVTCGLMYISVATNPQRRGWHDQIAGTAVVRTR